MRMARARSWSLDSVCESTHTVLAQQFTYELHIALHEGDALGVDSGQVGAYIVIVSIGVSKGAVLILTLKERYHDVLGGLL